MTKRWRIILILPLLAIAGGAIYFANQEPSYNGRRLSSWLKDLNSNADDDNLVPAQEAVRQIGTNALPYLLKELRRKDSPATSKLMNWNERLEARFNHSLMKLTPAVHRRSTAQEAFRALGSNAISAIPDLCLNLSDKEIAEESAMALAYIGQPALSVLKEQASSTNLITSYVCTEALTYCTNENDVIPILQKLASQGQQITRATAVGGLGQFTNSPETCVPILSNLLNDSDDYVKSVACLSLANFGTNSLPAAGALSNVFVSSPNDLNLNGNAAHALRELGPSSVPIFLQLLTNPDGHVRANAVIEFSCLHTTNHLPEMLLLLHDPDDRARRCAVRALSIVRPEPEVFMPAFIEAFKLEGDKLVIEEYLRMLSEYAPAATNAMPRLIELAQKFPNMNRDWVLQAVADIDADAAIKLGADSRTLDIARTRKQSRTLPTETSSISAPPPP